ncbi:hypothetical protein MBLNU459_g5379t1 [Dothideomycetes sp. NU459]
MSTRQSGARFRQRKLSTKHPLQVVREHDIETFAIDDDPQRHIQHVETGVEKAEEIEHHLQAVISASAAASLGGKVAQVFIPTPETKSSGIPYDQLYPRVFSQGPQSYIRFSSTVEDCIGPQYCVDEEDDVFILNINQAKKDGEARISEDLFEEVVSFFEETTQELQPHAAVDNPPPPSYEQLEARFEDDKISLDARSWAKDVYEHWRRRRLEKLNHSLLPALKIETGQETDDADAYVCFRRREVRQARKTRGRDAQVVEKLKKMRREFEDARQIIHSVTQRERLNMERIEVERKVFEQRSELKRVKIQQGIKDDKGEDENLLVNQRPAPKAKPEPKSTQPRPATLRLSNRGSETRGPENDLIQLSDIQEEQNAAVQKSIEEKIGQHRKWNTGWEDRTWIPLTPPAETSASAGYMPHVEEVQLPTPPASIRSESSIDLQKDVEMKDSDADLPTPVSAQEQPLRTMFRFNSPPAEPGAERPAFRRRYGRNGRMHVEAVRARTFVPHKGVVYDSDDESDGEPAIYQVDNFGYLSINYRAGLLVSKRQADPTAEQVLRRTTSSADIAMTNGQSTAGPTASHAHPQPAAN